MEFNFDILLKWGPFILQGIWIVLILSFASAVIGVSIGLFCAFFKEKRIIGKLLSFYIDFFRGTPVYVQLYFVYFGFPALLGVSFDKWVAAIIVFGLNSGAYLAEIMRAGIEGIDKGQIEAAKALGITQRDIVKDIILPQAIRAILPAIVNEFIALTKETSVVSVIGINDLMKRYSFVVAKTYSPFEPLTLILITYYILNKILSYIGKRVERKLKYD